MRSQGAHSTRLQPELVPLHIDPFQEGGMWYARAREFGIVSHGDSEADAMHHVYNMVMRAVFVAAADGSLPKILAKAGVEIRIGFPADDSEQAGPTKLWFIPLAQSANHVSRA